MGSDEGKEYTLAVIDIGRVNLGWSEYYFEISPYCKDGDLAKYVSLDDEYKIVIPKDKLENISKKYLGYSYDFTKNYDIETFVITSEYDSKNKNVIITLW